MRWLFVLIVVVLFEAITYGAGRGLQWFFANWFNAQQSRYLLWGLFAISHVFLLVAITRISPIGLKLAMSWLTVLWFIVMVTLAVGLVHALLGKFAADITLSPAYQAWGVPVMLAVGVVSLLAMGVYNAYTPVVRHLTITANHAMPKPMRIGMVSDLHFGWLVGNREIDLLTDIVKQEKVEMLLMPGDIMDDNVLEYQAKHMQPHLENLVKALPFGVYATLGNHDLYGYRAEITQALTDAGIKVLIDEQVKVDNRVWLVGRLDNHASERKPTAALMPSVAGNVPIDAPVILLDHEPNEIDSNVKLPIDLQLSGHTHNGQIFPANFIVKMLNTVAYGHKRINDTDVVVSSGYGFWGVPFRLGSQMEIWVIDIVGKK